MIKNKYLIYPLIFIFFSCSIPSENNKSTKTFFKTNQLINYFPTPKLGLKYSYLSSEKRGLAQILKRYEYTVSEINNTNIIKLTSLIDNVTGSIEINKEKPPFFTDIDYLYEGEEFITVIAGSYSADRFSYSTNNNDRFDLWLSKDVGVVRLSERKSSGDSILTELTEFRF